MMHPKSEFRCLVHLCDIRCWHPSPERNFLNYQQVCWLIPCSLSPNPPLLLIFFHTQIFGAKQYCNILRHDKYNFHLDVCEVSTPHV